MYSRCKIIWILFIKQVKIHLQILYIPKSELGIRIQEEMVLDVFQIFREK